jgi:hypothetical protein
LLISDHNSPTWSADPGVIHFTKAEMGNFCPEKMTVLNTDDKRNEGVHRLLFLQLSIFRDVEHHAGCQ